MAFKKILKHKEPYPMGCFRKGDDLEISVALYGEKENGIVLCKRGSNHRDLVLLPQEYRQGNLYSVILPGAGKEYDAYILYEDAILRPDPYARRIYGMEEWGKYVDQADLLCGFTETIPNFENRVQCPNIPMKDTLLYLLQVRGYTMHPSSKVPKKLRGTFRGLVEKIPYLKELGVTSVELMPIMERQSVIREKKHSAYLTHPINDSKSLARVPDAIYEQQPDRVNLWGYTSGYYFAPQSALCSDKENPEQEVKNTIEAFHKAGMEIILQFYFNEEQSDSYIMDALRHWAITYHVDGFHLKGANLPLTVIATDPLLSGCKIFYDYFDTGRIRILQGSSHAEPMIAQYRNDFQSCARRFVKGDDRALNEFLSFHLRPTVGMEDVHYVANYEGLRLVDAVAYEHKHNEDNGENNQDGTDQNDSWNCGVEGPSRKKNITELRKKQVRNLATMLFLSPGIPMLFGGDEFGNSQEGNNNPYCQDNKIGWVNWSVQEKNSDLTNLVKDLISFRQEHDFFHPGMPFKLMDTKSCGYPDLSMHGKEAWRPDLTDYSHSIGLLYAGEYSKEAGSLYYIAYNMHWEPLEFALPGLPEGYGWTLLLETEHEEFTEIPLKDNGKITCPPRSICILQGRQQKKSK